MIESPVMTQQRSGYAAGKPMIIKVHLPGILLAVFAAVPFYKPAVQPWFPADVTAILAALCIVVSFPEAMRVIFAQGVRYADRREFALYWTGFVAVVLLGVLNSPRVEDAAWTAAELIGSVIAPLLLLMVVSRERGSIVQFLYTLFTIGAFVTLAGLVTDVTVGRAERIIVFGSNPINVSIAATLVPIVGFGLIWRRHVVARPVIVLLSAPALWLAAISARGPLISAAVAMGSFFLTQSAKAAMRVIVAIALAIAFLPMVASLVLPDGTIQRFTSLFNFVPAFITGSEIQGSDTNLQTRFELFRVAAEMFQQSPAIGNGLNSFQFQLRDIPYLSHLTYPHNIVLEFAAAFGVVGLLWLFVAVARSLRSLFAWRHDAVIATVGILFLSSFLEAMVSGGMGNRLLWTSMFLLVALPSVNNEDDAQLGYDGSRLEVRKEA